MTRSNRPWLRVVKDQPTPGQLRQMFPQLPWSSLDPVAQIPGNGATGLHPSGDPRWELRGSARTRATFAQPHPADFTGGLPQPPEYPEDTGRP